MPVIVTATDFSDVATTAVHYACALAKDINASVVVFHSFVLPVAFHDTPMPVLPIDEGKKIAEEGLARLLANLNEKYPGVSISGKVSYGDITDSLEEYVEETSPALVVIGNSGAEDDAILWLGSNLLSTIRNISAPTLAVPPNIGYHTIKTLCYACDYKTDADKLPATQLSELIKLTGAELHILNVDHNNQQFGTELPQHFLSIQDKLKHLDPKYHFTDNNDVDAGIQKFVDEQSMDWLVVIPHSHSFLEGLFHKSHTKAMVRMSTIPLLALHEKK